MHPSEIKISDYTYDLPDERIARFPLEQRDQSKLLIFQNDNIQEAIYHDIANYIPKKSLLIFNQAKVIHARLFFQKETGGKLEIFCLEPDKRYPDITTAMMQEKEVYWKCLLKGAHKWKDVSALTMDADYVNEKGEKVQFHATANRVERDGNSFILHIKWNSDNGNSYSFSEFLEHAGKIPIPPYLKREAEASDDVRYQTIFAKNEGSVAAPTASLHFTPYILDEFKHHEIDMANLTLHVGAGTFMPVKSEKMEGHQMHSEWIEFSTNLVERVISQLIDNQNIICIGTTSARTLESIYWIGVQILRNEWNEEKMHDIAVSQWYPYEVKDNFSAQEAFSAVLNYMQENKLSKIITRTQIIIAPGYDFRVLNAMITNFHQPESTLILMISALVGDSWKSIYQYALDHNFRFLSYGDGSLLWKK